MPEPDARRHELMAAALAGDLSPAEKAELDRLRAADPGIDLELAELRPTVDALGALSPWREIPPVVPISGPPPALRRSRRGWVPVLAAAACLALGLLAGAALPGLVDRPVSGPPGTLGALEPISFVASASGARIDGEVVAHTWGTETILEIEGLPVGETFDVVLVDHDGREYASGTFLGSAALIECRINAAVLREDVVSVEIRTSGEDVAVASIPSVS